MALDYREVTMQQAANIIGCSKEVVKTMVKRGHIGVMRYYTRGGRVHKMLSQEDAELVAEQRRFDAFGLEYRGVVVFGPDEELRRAAASALRIAGFHVDVAVTAWSALSCGGNERPVLIQCGVTRVDDGFLDPMAADFDWYDFTKSEELRPLVRWAWERVKARHEALSA